MNDAHRDESERDEPERDAPNGAEPTRDGADSGGSGESGTAPLSSGPGGPKDPVVRPEPRPDRPDARRGAEPTLGPAETAGRDAGAPAGRPRPPVVGVGSGRGAAPAVPPPAPAPAPAPAGRAAAAPWSALVLTAGALLGLAAVAAVLAVAGVSSQPVAGLALLFLLVGPGAGLAWALPGQELRLRLLVALLGGLAVDTVIAQAMLSLRWWSPRGGALAALLVTGALFALGALAGRTRRAGPAAERAATD